MDDSHSLVPGPLLKWGRRLDRWLDSLEVDAASDLGAAARFWGNPRWALFCLLFLLGTFLMPGDGFGVRLCLFHQFTGMDCPGCGMTRGVAQVWHGSLTEAFHLHLFAPLMFLFLWLQSVSLFLPIPWKTQALFWIDRHDQAVRRVWIGGAFCFFAYGAFRIAYALFRDGLQ